MKRRVRAAAALAAVAILAPVCTRAADAPYSNLKWREIGPSVAGGRVAAVAGTPQDDKLYYIGTAGAGVWKTENGGATWEPVFDGQRVSSIGAVAIDPTNEQTVWAGSGEANPRQNISYGDGLYKSTDGGKHWTRFDLGGARQISRVRIDPKNSRHVVVTTFGDFFADNTGGGVFVTFDGGKSWTHSLYVGPKSGGCDLAMDPNDPNVLYAGIWEFRRKPWTFTSGGPDDGIFKSVDGGRHWKKLTAHGLPEGITGRIGLAIAPSDSKRVYAIIESKSGILWRSNDSGASWKLVSSDTLVDQRPFYFTHIDVDPKNANHVYAVSEMLAESKDGGKKFEEVAKDVHVDYHAIWIAPNDPKRMMTGEDGGYALTLDEGKHWSFSRNLPIGQIYHVGLSNENPYTICGGWQDNNGWCGPSNSLDGEGIKDEHWTNVIPGDGMWAEPDPTDPNLIWTDLQDGRISIFNRKTQSSRFIMPYLTFSVNTFDSRNEKYRFNWNSPVAFAPWDPHVAWYGGNVVFQTSDHGEHWTPISPDLTRNVKEHQAPAGGPLVHDVSGAEYSDNILYIEGSRLNKGEIWVGTDDGLVQLTRDDGAHWENVTPPNAPEFGRVEGAAPSALVPGTAYVNMDDHKLGDYKPYVFVTHDYGKTWSKIVNGLPNDQYVRTVRPDPRNANLVYAGTENGLYLSYDGGAHWQNFRINLPQVSVRDIRVQPTFNDIVIATHGRAFWVLDDATSVQNLPSAERNGLTLFAPRTSYEYHYHSNDLGAYTRFAGANPPNGVIIDYYQARAESKAPEIEIADAKGTIVRTIKGTHKVKGKEVPYVSNKAGINRVVWDFHEDGPTLWMGAAKEEYRGSKSGALVVPGTYTVRLVVGGKTLSQNVEIKPDPRDSWTQADYEAGYAFGKRYFIREGKVNEALNGLDAIKKSLEAAQSSLKHGHNEALLGKVDAAIQQRDAIFATFTADYHNDEDSIQRPGALREDMPGGFFTGGNRPPTAAMQTYATEFDAQYDAAIGKYNALVSQMAELSSQLKAAGLKPVDGAKTVQP